MDDRGVGPATATTSAGTLYPTLHRCEADGCGVRATVLEGRARRVHQATEAGKRTLAEDLRALPRAVLDRGGPLTC
ncbi:PadR family transcriptional regulator [Micromonospora marina]|uniref:PadR family transcriptional regulator n=1 Tax=Micromonospora marina TaxID=307120 RepID=UPI003D711BA1